MNLNQLLEKAITTVSFKNEYYDDIESVLEDLNGFCKQDEVGYLYNGSIINFALQDEVVGSYIIFDSCPHYPGIRMYSFDSIGDVESHLISESSILNEFTGFSVVFHGDVELLYEIWFLANEKKTVRFIKSQQKGFGSKYPKATVEWLGFVA